MRVLLTVGRDLDLGALPEAPANVRHRALGAATGRAGPRAAAVVHGGSGSTLGALAAGLPLVVVPLFADQPENARRVARGGRGHLRRAHARGPGRDDGAAPRRAIETVLADPSYGERARAIADELRAEPPVDEAIPLLERLRRR